MGPVYGLSKRRQRGAVKLGLGGTQPLSFMVAACVSSLPR